MGWWRGSSLGHTTPRSRAAARCTILVTCKRQTGPVGFAGSGDTPRVTRLGGRRRRGAVAVVGKISISGRRAVVAGAVAMLVVGTGLAAAATPAAVGSGEVPTRVPVDRSGQQANGNSFQPAISADGRF